MAFRIRTPDADAQFSRSVSVDALASVIPPAVIEEVLTNEQATAVRVRKLTMTTVVFVLIGMHLYASVSLGTVLRKLARGVRLFWDDPEIILPGASALSYRRYQLGARPIVALFHRTCQPLTTPDTPGAFAFGRRLMALDGTIEEIPDTSANVRVYGRHRGRRGPSAFPLVRAVALVECGSHAIIEAGLWSLRVGESTAAKRLVRRLSAEMLLLWDCNFHSYDLVAAVQRRGTAVLGRLPASVHPQSVRTLADGSALVTLRPGHHGPRTARGPLTVRLLTYTFNDPGRPGHGQRHRLITTLLDPTTAPADALIATYHERWEFETTLDEVDTHQRLVGQPFRSRRPVGVVQEFYALLLAHYVVRSLMHTAARQAGLDPDRLSFVAALELVRDAIPEFQLVVPDDQPRLLRRLLHDLARATIPPRRNRSHPRVVKRAQSKFRRKRPEHAHWPQPTKPFAAAVVLI